MSSPVSLLGDLRSDLVCPLKREKEGQRERENEEGEEEGGDHPPEVCMIGKQIVLMTRTEVYRL